MYFPAGIVPTWLAALGWAAAAASVAVALLRLRREAPKWPAFVGGAALVAALRLLEFPLGKEVPHGASVLAVGFAVVVFGPEVGVCALAAATVVAGVLTVDSSLSATAANLLVYAAVAPWLLWAAYAGLKRVFRSRVSGYVLAFALGAAGGPLVAAATAAVAAAAGALDAAAARRLFHAGMAVMAAEGVLAAWGYAFALSPDYEGDGRAVGWRPRAWPGGGVLIIAAVVLAAAAAPWVPVYGGPLGPLPALARAAGVAFGVRVALGVATTALAAAGAAALFLIARTLRPRRR
ncbi:MAG: energy-coupling factor ABC transporter permease [Candidatus Coatesbacteria bacterium]|nr:MAG: energy-coupling factor ABC transporter permease [Candidatus Coatesbacteria bacterium]